MGDGWLVEPRVPTFIKPGWGKQSLLWPDGG